jgi:PKD repeat protein
MMHAQMIVDGAGNALLAAGTYFEMAVCKVRADGSAAWTLTTTGSYANAFALASDGDVVVVGGATARLGDAGTTGPRPPIAVASASQSSGVWPLTVYFSSAGSLDPDGGALTYAWSFGNGATATTAATSHTYTVPGTYTATLTVTDPEGLSSSASVVVNVTPRLLRVADIGLSALRSRGIITVQGAVTVRDGSLALVPGATVSARWNLPNGVVRTGTALTNAQGVASFSTRGTRGTVTLTVTGVTKSGHTFDARGSTLTSRSISL